jgi:hypothetical protein
MLGNQYEAFVGFYKNNKLHGKAIYYRKGKKMLEGIW